MRATKFFLNDQYIECEGIRADDMLLDFLRDKERLVGTKEGCAEGDCGACTVLIGKVQDGALSYKSMNACIAPLALIDGAHIVTIEALSASGSLHWIQQALMDFHGTQCGFCTPGIVMSLYAMWMNNPTPTRRDIEIALQGNLCRCTGYISIINGVLSRVQDANNTADPLFEHRNSILEKLAALDLSDPVLNEGVYVPRDLAQLQDVLTLETNVRFVSGATDVGLWITKRFADISPAVFLANIRELNEITSDDDTLSIGAAVTYAAAFESLCEAFPEIAPYWLRIGGAQIRNMGTIGGNIANGSPIGDTPPLWIALGAKLVLNHMGQRREIALEDFFLDYGKQDRKAGEIVEKIIIPKRNQKLFVEKVSKRPEEDISTVAMAMSLHLDDNVIRDACIAYGGMAATPKRAHSVENTLRGKAFNEENMRQAIQALGEDFSPISDARASRDYRLKVAGNLLLRTVM